MKHKCQSETLKPYKMIFFVIFFKVQWLLFTQRHSKILFCEPSDDSQTGNAPLELSQSNQFSSGSKAGQWAASPHDHWLPERPPTHRADSAQLIHSTFISHGGALARPTGGAAFLNALHLTTFKLVQTLICTDQSMLFFISTLAFC